MLLRVFVLLCIFLGGAIAPATAFPISQKMTTSQLQSTCGKVGGSFDDYGSAGLMGTCTKKNCDGKGGDCKVTCDEQGRCVGSTPNALHGAQTLVSILQNGDAVLHDIDTTPTGSLTSPVEGASVAPAAPADSGPWLF